MSAVSASNVVAGSMPGGDPPPYMPIIPPFTDIDLYREALTLDVLAAETARTDPWTAATKLFGGDR